MTERAPSHGLGTGTAQPFTHLSSPSMRQYLEEMGFDKEAALAALRSAKGDVDVAIEHLVRRAT